MSGSRRPCRQKGEGMLDDIKYFRSFVWKRTHLVNVTPVIEVESMCKMRDSQIIVKKREVLSNCCIYVAMGDTVLHL